MNNAMRCDAMHFWHWIGVTGKEARGLKQRRREWFHPQSHNPHRSTKTSDGGRKCWKSVGNGGRRLLLFSSHTTPRGNRLWRRRESHRSRRRDRPYFIHRSCAILKKILLSKVRVRKKWMIEIPERAWRLSSRASRHKCRLRSIRHDPRNRRQSIASLQAANCHRPLPNGKSPDDCCNLASRWVSSVLAGPMSWNRIDCTVVFVVVFRR